MSDLERLIHGGSQEERDALGAWTATRAPAEARARALALAAGAASIVAASTAASAASASAGGATASATTTSALAGASTAGTAGGLTAAAAPKVATGVSLPVMKWFAAVGIAAAAGVSVAGIRYVRSSAEPARSAGPVVTAPTGVVVDRSTSRQLATLQQVREGEALKDELVVPVSVPAATSSAPRTPSSALSGRRRIPAAARPKDEGLPTQLSVLDEARDALASGDTANALRRLDVFDARYPASALRVEAAALRFDALLASGDRVAAEAAGRALIDRWPSSPYAARIWRALDASP